MTDWILLRLRLDLDIISKIIICSLLILFSGCSVHVTKSNSKPIDHNLWDADLKKFVDYKGFVDYKSWKKDQTNLNAYLKLLSQNPPNDTYWTKNEQKAYWINLYNAFTVSLILIHYPINSIKDIKNGVPFVNTVWDIKFIEVKNEFYDLNNIEHGILRSKFKDARLHSALNCASFSCPALSQDAYKAEILELQLDSATSSFLKDTLRNRIDLKPMKISSIFKWYFMDYRSEGGVKKFITKYVPGFSDSKITYLEYNWNLNEQKKATSR
jgi:hypothetical protein